MKLNDYQQASREIELALFRYVEADLKQLANLNIVTAVDDFLARWENKIPKVKNHKHMLNKKIKKIKNSKFAQNSKNIQKVDEKIYETYRQTIIRMCYDIDLLKFDDFEKKANRICKTVEKAKENFNDNRYS